MQHLLTRISGAVDKLSYATGLKSKSRLCLPDFLGIGAQKSGTTWLAQNLRCHPEVYLPESKELHYFNQNFHRSLQSYSELFVAAADKTKGEITPAYTMLSRSRIKTVYRLMPNVRLFFMMRNPIERAWSQAMMELVKRKGKELTDVPHDEFITFFRSDHSLLRGDYERSINNWLSVFPENQLLIGFFEEISSDPKSLLLRVFEHLGVGQEVDWQTFPYQEKIFSGNQTSEIPPQIHNVLKDIYSDKIQSLASRFGGHANAWCEG